MFNKRLRKRILELEEQLEKARNYTDISNYECPLCGEMNELTSIPISYCALHKQLALTEKEADENIEEIEEICEQIANEHRRAIDKIMLMAMNTPLNLTEKQLAMIGAVLSESEMRIQKLSKQKNIQWLYELTYIQKD